MSRWPKERIRDKAALTEMMPLKIDRYSWLGVEKDPKLTQMVPHSCEAFWPLGSRGENDHRSSARTGAVPRKAWLESIVMKAIRNHKAFVLETLVDEEIRSKGSAVQKHDRLFSGETTRLEGQARTN